MSQEELNELAKRILKSVVEENYNDNDITSLVNKAFDQQSTIERLESDVERLTQAVIDAGEHITKLESRKDA